MRTTRVLAASLFLSAMVVLPGCGTTYVPDASAANPKRVPDFPAGTSIALINAQPATEPVLIGSAGMGRTVHASLHAWTDQAIVALERTLEKKGVAVNDHSGKSLKVAITEAVLTDKGVGFQCTVHFTVETSDGKVTSLVALSTYWKYLSACDRVMTNMAVVALNDQGIAGFLTAH